MGDQCRADIKEKDLQMNLAPRLYKNFGCRENQNPQNGVPRSRHSNKEPFIVKHREWDELCSRNENSHPALEEDTAPSTPSFGALSGSHFQTLWLSQGTAKEGRCSGDGDVVPWHFSPADEFT